MGLPFQACEIIDSHLNSTASTTFRLCEAQENAKGSVLPQLN